MTRPRAEQPPFPKAYPDGRGGKKWMTYWTDDSGIGRTKTFGGQELNERRVGRLYQTWLDHEWRAKFHVRNPKSAIAAYTVARLARQYLSWARSIYRKNGKPTSHVKNIRLGLRSLVNRHGRELAEDFNAHKLAEWRDALIFEDRDADKPRAASTINDRLGIIRIAFTWAREKGRVSANVANDLQNVRRISPVRSKAKGRRKVMSVDRDTVELTKAHMPPHLADLIELLWLTGMRPGEACSMKPCEIEANGRVWLYRPGSWKTEHMPNAPRRVVPLGPEAIKVLQRNLPNDTTANVFSPARTHAERMAGRKGKKAETWAPSDGITNRYTTDSLRGAIMYACGLAKIEMWSPNRLRHAAATRLRKDYGEEGAKAVLGHTSVGMTQVYLDPDRQLAMKIMGEVG